MPKSIGKDRDGAEFTIEEGTGRVTRLELQEGKRNASIEITDDNPDLRYPFKGWLDTQQIGLYEFAEQAHHDGEHVSYRIETHRDRNIDPSVPIGKIEPRSKFRRLVVLEPASSGTAGHGVQGEPATPRSVGHETPSRPESPQARPEPQRGQWDDPGPQSEEDYGRVVTLAPKPTTGMFTIEEFDGERRRLSNQLAEANTELRQAAGRYADAERTYRKAKAKSWLNAPRSENRGEWTAAEREAWVNADTADLRFKRDLADGERQAALELIRSLRAELSSLQSELNAHREEAGLARVGGDL